MTSSDTLDVSSAVLICKFCEMKGYTKKAVEQKIAKGVWRLDEHYIKAPDGKIHIIMDAYYSWLRSERPSA